MGEAAGALQGQWGGVAGAEFAATPARSVALVAVMDARNAKRLPVTREAFLFVCAGGGVGTVESCNVCHAACCMLQIADFSLSDKRLGQKKSMLQSCCSVLQLTAGNPADQPARENHSRISVCDRFLRQITVFALWDKTLRDEESCDRSRDKCDRFFGDGRG